jgi:hypothetical protein
MGEQNMLGQHCLLACSGWRPYAALLLGTATIFTNLGAFIEKTGAALGAEWP